MAISIHRSLVEYILLGPTGDRRQLQDSPILADVWIAFADKPEEPKKVLITPDWEHTAHEVAMDLDDLIDGYRGKFPTREGEKADEHRVPQKIIAARLYFDELLRVLVPVTCWWKAERNNQEMRTYLDATKGPARLKKVMTLLAGMAAHWSAPSESKRVEGALSSFDRYAALAGLIMWAHRFAERRRPCSDRATASRGDQGRDERHRCASEGLARSLPGGRPARRKEGKERQDQRRVRPSTADLPGLAQPPGGSGHRSFRRLGQGRRGTRALSVNCSQIGWAVVDSGIQGIILLSKARTDSPGSRRASTSADTGRSSASITGESSRRGERSQAESGNRSLIVRPRSSEPSIAQGCKEDIEGALRRPDQQAAGPMGARGAFRSDQDRSRAEGQRSRDARRRDHRRREAEGGIHSGIRGQAGIRSRHVPGHQAHDFG